MICRPDDTVTAPSGGSATVSKVKGFDLTRPLADPRDGRSRSNAAAQPYVSIVMRMSQLASRRQSVIKVVSQIVHSLGILAVLPIPIQLRASGRLYLGFLVHDATPDAPRDQRSGESGSTSSGFLVDVPGALRSASVPI